MHHEETEFNSALIVNEGIPQPPSVSDASVERYKRTRRKKLTADEYFEGIRSGNRTILSQAITIIESSLTEHHQLASKIVEKCLPYTGNSIRIGITGVPGVGKSSFIETFGTYLTQLGHSIAVLAIDPSSERSKGSILGDKTRMEQLSVDPKAFIRPSPSAGSLGGVARKTRETIYLCEAAGFDIIFIETVGVGQSEIAVHSMTDFFLLLMLAGAGDELQGIKRGIMEMADLVAITKADGSNKDKANRAKAEYQSALHLFPMPESNWAPRVLACSAHDGSGIPDLWNAISDYISVTRQNGFFNQKRIRQSKYWMYEAINEALKRNFYNNVNIQSMLLMAEKDVIEGKVSSFDAATNLIDNYLKFK